MFKVGSTTIQKVIVKKGNQSTELTELVCNGKVVFAKNNYLRLSISGGKVSSAYFDYKPKVAQEFVVYTMYTDWRNAENWSNGAHTGVSLYSKVAHINTNMDNATIKSSLSGLVFNSNGIVVIAEKPSTAKYPSYSPVLNVDLKQWKKDGNANIWQCFESWCSPIVLKDLIYPIGVYINVHYNPKFLSWDWNFRGDVYLNSRTLVSYNYRKSGNADSFEYPRLGNRVQDNEKGIIRDAAKCNASSIALDVSKNRHIQLTYGYGMNGYASSNIILREFNKTLV